MEQSNSKHEAEQLISAFQKHLEDLYEDFIELECEKASNRIREKMKKEQDRVVISLLQNYSIERFGADLRITVHHFYKEPKDNQDLS